ncbi:MAG: sialate O-acetylesterase [Chitinophagaceae bacterium]
MRIILIGFFILSASVTVLGQLRLPAILSPGMVLQQNDSVSVWGWGNNNQKVKITGSWNNDSIITTVNNHGKWSAKIKTPAAGGPYVLTISSGRDKINLDNVMTGEVWLCSGQSNMEWNYYNGDKFIKEELPTSYNKNIRFFQIPRTASKYPQDDLKAKWQVCDSNSLKTFSSVGYYFGKKLQHDLNVPIGLINASWGGTPAEVWAPAETIENNEVLKTAASKLREVPWGPVTPGFNYNGMLAPITNYNISGVLWYQGEANVETNSTYAQLLTTMINAWRKKWNKDFPFYYVQIAPYNYGKAFQGALLQEQQTRVMGYPKTGMIVITDQIDSITNIHPSDKREVGKRLANLALGDTYKKDIPEYKSPVFKNAELKKDKLILTFDHAPTGLMAKDKTITGFFISGENEEWLPAEAKIENNTIVVRNKKLKAPIYVRYGFGNTLIGNVFNKEGLPLVPFRSDNWPVK